MNTFLLFGFGRAGKIHYKNIMDHPNINIKYVVDMVDISDQLPQTTQYIHCGDKERLIIALQDQCLDGVIIASPTKYHYEHIMLCLSNDKHIFVEKPVSESYKETKECFEEAEKRKLHMFVGFNRRFDPMLMSIKNRMMNNEIGKVNYATTTSRDYPYPLESFMKISAGIFNDCASHDIDYMNWILNDKPISVNVVHSEGDNYNYDHVSLQFKYSKGTIVCMNLSRVSTNYDQRCEFYGDEGEILNNIFIPNIQTSFPERYRESYKNELQAFCGCLENDTSPLVTKDDCLTTYAIVKACEKAVDNRKTITIKYGENDFRDYTMVAPAVRDNYHMARVNQTVKFVSRMHKTFEKMDMKIEIWDILEDLNQLIDVSDPDLAHPNLHHAFQTAEGMRIDNQPDWMQLTGLLHDIGKIMYKKGKDEDGTSKNKQWAMVGDTFMVGCKLPDTLLFSEINEKNPNMKNPFYNTKNGIYEPGCGLDSMICSWGHDEYLYRILTSDKNQNSLPPEALYMVRFHSLYAYHDKMEYMQFQSKKDKNIFPLLKIFNKYDLYTKSDNILDIDKLKPYYTKLIKKYFKNSYLYI